MSLPQVDYTEPKAQRRTAGVPLSHVSIEVGHLYMEDFIRGPEYLVSQFELVRPWAHVPEQTLRATLGGKQPRVSTCFMIDDYFNPLDSPAKVIPDLLHAADRAGLSIDYIARESGCAQAGEVSLARLVQGRLVEEPPPGTTGSRPPVGETGWLANGQRSPNGAHAEALRDEPLWRPPVENGARRHSIFIDVELWDLGKDGRGAVTWSCAFLAAVWQLLRLGLIRNRGKAVITPQPWFDPPYPDDWADLPAVIQINRNAQPFCAYQTMSVLGSRFLSVEGAAVRTILERLDVDLDAQRQILRRGEQEKLSLPREAFDRVSYLFLPENPFQPESKGG